MEERKKERKKINKQTPEPLQRVVFPVSKSINQQYNAMKFDGK